MKKFSAQSRPPRLVLATNNAHKVIEIRSILRAAGLKMNVLTLADFPKKRAVVEDKRTIEGNAKKKARVVAKQTGSWALADDSGLFVEALHGKPGVYSARFAGPRCSYEDNNRKILTLLGSTPWSKRGALFRCIAALATPDGRTVLADGRIRGRIAFEPKGGKGFGYDPIFWVPKHKKTFAEMGPQLKNKLSHRAQAFQKVPFLIKRLMKLERE